MDEHHHFRIRHRGKSPEETSKELFEAFVINDAPEALATLPDVTGDESLAAKCCRIYDDVGFPISTEEFLDTALNRILAVKFVVSNFRMVRETKVDVADGVELKRLRRRRQDKGDLLHVLLIAATRLFFDIAISVAMSSVVVVVVALIIGLLVVLAMIDISIAGSCPFAGLVPFTGMFLFLSF